MLLQNTKTFNIGIFYRPPNYSDFVKDILEDFSKLLPEKNELFILGDININIFHNNRMLLENTKNVPIVPNSIPIPSIFKQYADFCSDFSLKQLIKSPTRISSKSSSLIDHILTNADEKISNSGVIDVGLSDHQLIFCTRKIIRPKFNMHKYINCRSYIIVNKKNFF